jgi:hypothetical protein
MTKHASTSHCIGKDGRGSCGGVPLPLPLPPSPCLPPSLCTLLLPLSLPLLLSSPWRCPRANAATNDNSSKHSAPPQPPLSLLLLSTWGGGSTRVLARRCRPFWPIAAASPRRIEIILASAAVAVLPLHPHLPLPPATTSSVAVDVYIGTTDLNAHRVLQTGHWCQCSCQAWDGREGEESNNNYRGVVGKWRDLAIKHRLPPPPHQPQPPLPPGPEPPSPSS